MIPVVLLGRVFQSRRYPIPLGRIVIDQIGNLEYAARGCLDQLEPGYRVSFLPLAQFLNDVLHFLNFVLSALARLTLGM